MATDHYIEIDGTKFYFDGFPNFGFVSAQDSFDTAPTPEGQIAIQTGLWVDEWQFTIEFTSITNHGHGTTAVDKFNAFREFVKGSGVDGELITLYLTWPNSEILEMDGGIGSLRASASVGGWQSIQVMFDFGESDE